MRVFQRGSGRLAVIFEEQNIAKTAVIFEVEHPVAVGPEYLFYRSFASSWEA